MDHLGSDFNFISGDYPSRTARHYGEVHVWTIGEQLITTL